MVYSFDGFVYRKNSSLDSEKDLFRRENNGFYLLHCVLVIDRDPFVDLIRCNRSYFYHYFVQNSRRCKGIFIAIRVDKSITYIKKLGLLLFFIECIRTELHRRKWCFIFFLYTISHSSFPQSSFHAKILPGTRLSNESAASLQINIVTPSEKVPISYGIRFSVLAMGFNGLRNPLRRS